MIHGELLVAGGESIRAKVNWVVAVGNRSCLKVIVEIV